MSYIGMGFDGLRASAFDLCRGASSEIKKRGESISKISPQYFGPTRRPEVSDEDYARRKNLPARTLDWFEPVGSRFTTGWGTDSEAVIRQFTGRMRLRSLLDMCVAGRIS